MYRDYVAGVGFVCGFAISGIALYWLFTRAGVARTAFLTLVATFGLVLMVVSLLFYMREMFGPSSSVDDAARGGTHETDPVCPDCGADRVKSINVQAIYRCRDCGRVFDAGNP